MKVTEQQARESWKTTIEAYEFFLTTYHGRRLAPLLSLVKALSEDPLARPLIAHTSHCDLVIAWVPDVFPDHPHVVVRMLTDGSFNCELCDGVENQKVLRTERSTESGVKEVVVELIKDLIRLTRSSHSE
jgi:hypothetical protein